MKPAEQPKDEKPASEEAKRAVVKPQKIKTEPAQEEKTWAGGVDHFSERV